MGKAAKEQEKEGFGMHFGKSDLVRIGLFSESPGIVGDTYNDKKGASALDGRAKGKQFLTSPAKKGHDSKDAYFQKDFGRVFENEPYSDIVALRRKWRAEAKEKNISAAQFRPSGVPPKPSGKGSRWGTIEQQWPLVRKPPPPLRPVPEVKKQKEPPNFSTAPSKQGSGYGYPNVTIGKSYEYQSDPYDRAEKLAKQDRTEKLLKLVGGKAFVSSSSSTRYFNPFLGLSKEGVPLDPLAAPAPKFLLPFKPTSKCGATINPYPQNEPPKVPELPPKLKSQTLIFKPSGVTGSYPIRSIVESNVKVGAPSWMQESIRNAVIASRYD